MLTPPSVSTQSVNNITSTIATGNGNITDFGSSNPTQYGIVWSTSTNPTIALSTKTEQGNASAAGAFTSNITGLTAGTTYYVRAYAINSAGTSYGNEVIFTTLKAPTVTTQAVSSISATTATANGNITDLGVPNPTQYGVVWNTSTNPTTALATRTTQGAKSSIGAFTSNITSGKRVSGASTITMQLARMSDRAPRTYANKLKEMFRAFQFEWKYLFEF